MIRILLCLLVFLWPNLSLAYQVSRPLESCTTEIGTLPTHTNDTKLICRKAYIVNYDYKSKIPVWVAYTIDSSRVLGCLPRPGNFTTDKSLYYKYRVRTQDYKDTGYDIGHLADAASMSWNSTALTESFILTNTVPQIPNFNRGVWKLLELKVRAWALLGKRMTVYVGTIYNPTSDKIGDGVTVPNKMYKIVVDRDTGESQAYLFENEPMAHEQLETFATSVIAIENLVGFTFPVPGDKNKITVPWRSNLKLLIMRKRSNCQLN